MSDLRDLYQEVILDHNKAPRNRGHVDCPTHEAHGFNPLCGDKITVSLKVSADGTVEDVRFEGNGCAISTASASMMTQAVKGKRVDECLALFESFHDLITKTACPVDAANRLGKLAVFSGVRDYPARVKCATLAWHTLKAAMQGADEPITTE